MSSGTVTRQVIDRIKTALLQGELRPGDKLPTEGALCQMWQVSRTPIREAVKVLEFMGLLEIRRSEGTFVCSGVKPAALNPLVFRLLFLADSVPQFLEFRSEVEQMVMRMAVERATEADISAMEASIRRMEAALGRDADADALLALELEFHQLLAKATGNILMAELAGELYSVFSQSVRRSHSAGGAKTAVEHHIRLLDSVRRRDLALGEAALKESLEAWRGSLPR